LTDLIDTCLELRLLVGYLGEKSQHGWWPSAFLSPTSVAFLQPLYPRSAHLAAYHGVVEAARVLHDEHIGIGQVYHLFRLPEEMEHELHEAASVPSGASLAAALRSPEAATRALMRIAREGLTAPEGPVRIGTRATLSEMDAVEDVARHYADAFHRSIRCFPYFTAS